MSERILKGRGAILTGAGAGIGRAIAKAFADAGAIVACIDIDRAGAERCAEEAGGGAFAFACDVSIPEQVAETIAQVVAKLPSVRILVNGAATRDPGATVVDLPVDIWMRTIAVNLTSAFLVSKAVIPHMARSGGGSIINIASQLGHVASPARPAYCASKGGLIQLSKVMAVDHAADGIRVNALCPGAVETERLSDRFGSIEESRKALGPKHPIGRLGRAEEVAQSALFLAGDSSSFVTGSSLVVDGGYIAV